MEKVLNQTELLAEAILESNEYIQMRLCEQEAMKDNETRALVEDATAKRAEVQRILTQGDMDHEALAAASNALQEAETALENSQTLVRLQESRNAFSEMMNEVNKLIKFIVTGEKDEPAPSGGCSGSCGSCGGCGSH